MYSGLCVCVCVCEEKGSGPAGGKRDEGAGAWAWANPQCCVLNRISVTLPLRIIIGSDEVISIKGVKEIPKNPRSDIHNLLTRLKRKWLT